MQFEAAKLRQRRRFSNPGYTIRRPAKRGLRRGRHPFLRLNIKPALRVATFLAGGAPLFRHIFFRNRLRGIFRVVPLRSRNAPGPLGSLSDGVTGNTLDFDSRKSRFEPWSDNLTACSQVVKIPPKHPLRPSGRGFWGDFCVSARWAIRGVLVAWLLSSNDQFSSLFAGHRGAAGIDRPCTT